MLHSSRGLRRTLSRLFSPRFLAVSSVLSLLLLAAPLPAAAQRGVNIAYLVDAPATLRIEDAASPERAVEYRGYVPSFMAFSRLPGGFNGVIWLRFTLDSNFEHPVSALRVDLGPSLPGVTRLFIPQGSGFTVMENAPPSGTFVLPQNVPSPDVFYARVDGVPGLWFRPVVGPDEARPPLPPLHFLLAALFGLGMLVLLVQYIRKAEEWRVWAAVTAGCGIVGAILPPLPAAGAAFTPMMAAAMLMPGLMLVLFVHTVRHLFDSPRTMPGFDNLLVLMYLVGGIVALAPLAPGFLWTSRYLPLSPVLLLPLLPLAMVALARSLRGCSLFFCASLLPILGVAASAWELTAPDSSHLAGNGGLWGLALSILLISFVPPEKDKAAAEEEDVFDSLNRSHALALKESSPATATGEEEPGLSAPEGAVRQTAQPTPAEEDAWPTIIADEQAAPAPQPREEFPALSLFNGNEAEPEPQTAPGPEPAPLSGPEPVALARDEALPIPDSALERYPSVWADPLPGQPAPPPAGPELPAVSPASPAARGCGSASPVTPGTPGPMPATASPAVHVLTIDEEEDAGALPGETPPVFDDVSARESATPVADADEAAPARERRSGRRMLFNLPLLIKSAYDLLAPLSERKNVGMTWYIAPQTGRLFEGEAELLESALRLLLRDMVEAVEQGNVRLNVRRLPDSAEGHLVFTIAEWDAKQSSHERKIAGLAEAWSLAEKTGGIFSVEHSPGGGTTVIFSAVFTALDKPGDAEPERPAPHPAGGEIRQAGPVPEADAEAPVAVQRFADYPDIAPPEPETETPSASMAPSGIDGDDLLGENGAARDPQRIIVADSAASSRARTAGVFTGTPYSVMECTSPVDAHALYVRHPSALIVMNADMPEVDIIAAIKDIRADDDAHGRTPAHAVALVGYAVQAERMMRAGCSRTVLKSALEDELLAVVEDLAPLPAAVKPEPPADRPVPEQATPGTAPAPEAPALTDTGPLAAPSARPVSVTPFPPRDTAAPETPAAEIPSPETLLDEALAHIPSMETAHAPVESPTPPAGPDTRQEEIPGPIAESGIFATALPAEDAGTAVPADSRAKGTEQDATRAASPGGLGLLDMIITDEDEQETGKEAVPVRKAPESTAVGEAVPPPAAAPETPDAAPGREATESTGAETPSAQGEPSKRKPKKGVRVVVRAAGQGSSQADKTKPEESTNPVQPAKHPESTKPAEPAKEPDARPLPAASAKPQPAAAAPTGHAEPDPILGEETVSQVRQMMESIQASTAPVSIPLPGEEDSVFKDMVPLIPGLIVELTDAMKDAARGKEEKSPMLVQEAAERVAGKAESFGLTRLERMARCVERAAAADDVEPMECVLADLDAWVERYKEALRQLHRDVQW